MFHWLYFNRHAAQTTVVIPGWSILPSFSSQLPRDNLWVLNDFIASEQVSDYITKVLGDEDVAVRIETVDTMLQQSIDRVFIFQ